MGNICINEYVDDLIYNASTLYENYIDSFGGEYLCPFFKDGKFIVDAKRFKTFNGKDIVINLEKSDHNAFSSDNKTIYWTGVKGKLAHELAHVIEYAQTGKPSKHIEDDAQYLADPGELAAHAMEFFFSPVKQQELIVAQYSMNKLDKELEGIFDYAKTFYPSAYKRYFKKAKKEEKPEMDYFYCDKLAEEDAIMGVNWTHYINSDMCTIDEWKDAGLDYVEDLYNNEEIDKEDYDEYREYYKYFEVDISPTE